MPFDRQTENLNLEREREREGNPTSFSVDIPLCLGKGVNWDRVGEGRGGGNCLALQILFTQPKNREGDQTLGLFQIRLSGLGEGRLIDCETFIVRSRHSFPLVSPVCSLSASSVDNWMCYGM